MTLLSKLKRFFIVSVSRESCRMFLDFTRGEYFLLSLDHLLRVQTSQILNPQSIERVWSRLQLLHSKTTKSCPHLVKRSAKWELKSRRESATFCPSSHTRIFHTRTKLLNIIAYLHQFFKGGESCLFGHTMGLGILHVPNSLHRSIYQIWRELPTYGLRGFLQVTLPRSLFLKL